MTKRMKFTITVSVPDECSVKETKDFIADALLSWPGQCMSPGANPSNAEQHDPFWFFQFRSIVEKRP